MIPFAWSLSLSSRYRDRYISSCACTRVCVCFVSNYRNDRAYLLVQSLTRWDICINILSWLTQRGMMICLSSYLWSENQLSHSFSFFLSLLILERNIYSSLFIETIGHIYPFIFIRVMSSEISSSYFSSRFRHVRCRWIDHWEIL